MAVQPGQKPLRGFVYPYDFSEAVDPNIVCIASGGSASKPTAAHQMPAGVTERAIESGDRHDLIKKFTMRCLVGEAVDDNEKVSIFDTNGYIGKAPHGKPLVGVTMGSQSVVEGYVEVDLTLMGILCDRSTERSDVDAATYDVVKTDYLLHVTYTATGAVAISIPTALLGVLSTLIVKDAGGSAGINNITISTEGSETIDGAATKVISTNYGVVALYNDGANWFTRG